MTANCNIGLDMDGVIIDHTATIISYFGINGLVVRPEQTSFANLGHIANEKTLNSLYDTMYGSIEGTAQSVLMAGAFSGIKELVDEGHKVSIISRRNNPQIAKIALRQVGVWPKLFGEHNTFFVKKTRDKFDVAKRLGVTVYVEDQPSILTDVMALIPHKVLFDANGVLSESPQYERVKSWSGIVRSIYSYANLPII